MSQIPQIFELIPRAALAALALVAILALWMIWRSLAPAAPGISLGYYEVVGRYAGGKLLRRIRGVLIDCTMLFSNPEVEEEFKQLLAEDLRLMRDLNPAGELLGRLGELRLEGLFRIVATREKLFRKHVIVQYGHVDKPLSAYAAAEERGKFTLGLGFQAKGVVSGELYTLPQPWVIHRVGKAWIHLFKPDAPGEPSEAAPEWLAKLALYAPAATELRALLRSKDEQLREKDRKLAEMGRELSAMATERDALRKAIQGFSTTGKLPESFAPKRLDFIDFAATGLPTIIGYYAADQLKIQPAAGLAVGLIIGFLIISRRR